ncbi:MAG TPA: ZIP family metal transporter [Actinomycetota bacterium]|nr:ZIP family metal transporter [Actinomycetota bacterium]
MATTAAPRYPAWVGWAAPAALAALMIALLFWLDPIGSLREVPPVEEIAVERTVLNEGEIRLELRNDGPDPVTVSQVLVNDAYWSFDVGDGTLGRLESTTLSIPYPWDEGLPLHISLITATGALVEHEIAAAALTPDSTGGTLGVYALLGLYMGLLPVVIGLFWFPALARASRRAIGFFLAFTVGLLAFLLVDTIAEGLELAGAAGAALDGAGLFAIGALTALVALFFLEAELKRRSKASAGLVLAYLVAAGIGLHNLGEGLAVGAALAAGEVALGTFLVAGFALHNTTEGLAIVAPLGREGTRPGLRHLALLGCLAGLPTIAGAWAGGFAFSPAPAAFAFGVAAGAIAQVVWAITRSSREGEGLTSRWGAAGFVLGLLVMYSTGLLTA